MLLYAIFALRQLSEKAIKHNRELNLVFVDQEKAFDRVNRDELWRVLEKYNVKGQLLDNIRAIYANSMSSVHTPDGLTDWFQVTSGVRQGCVLSPLLFIVEQPHKKQGQEGQCGGIYWGFYITGGLLGKRLE